MEQTEFSIAPLSDVLAVEQVLNVFDRWRMDPTPIDQYEQKGKAILKEKMSEFIEDGVPIEFVMLGFPFKSTNVRDKVISNIPDFAEELTLRNFAAFNREVKHVYHPGVRITIVSDGYVFNDILGIHDKVVEMYNEMSQDMIGGAPINWFQAQDFYPKRLKTSEVRSKIESQFGISAAKLEADILTNPDVNYLYKGIKMFMEEEVALREFPSHKQLIKEAKRIARAAMFRNEAYSGLVRNEFSGYIRLSMHKSVNDGAKYSFKIINCPKAVYSAWHCAIAQDEEGHLLTMHRIDAERAGYHLCYKDGKPYFFSKN